MAKLISYTKIVEVSGIHKSTLSSYRKIPHRDGDPVFPEPKLSKRGGSFGAEQGVFFDEDEAMRGVERIKEHRAQMKLNKIKAAQAKNRQDADERTCRAPTNFTLAMALMNQRLTNHA